MSIIVLDSRNLESTIFIYVHMHSIYMDSILIHYRLTYQ